MNLIYVADPMCSWCYGFSTTMDALLSDAGPAHPLQLALVMGGLRPYTTEVLSPDKANEIFSHWRHVHEATGQPFAAAPYTALHAPGFVYDTEPASRAAVTVRSLWPQHSWRYFQAVQSAFYAQGLDVTRTEVLADLAQAQGLERSYFEKAFLSDRMREATQQDFAQAQQWGIRGFPAVVAEHRGQLNLVANGHLPVDALRQRLAGLLAEPPGSEPSPS
jgi:putative protein-disulfide isomerase